MTAEHHELHPREATTASVRETFAGSGYGSDSPRVHRGQEAAFDAWLIERDTEMLRRHIDTVMEVQREAIIAGMVEADARGYQRALDERAQDKTRLRPLRDLDTFEGEPSPE